MTDYLTGPKPGLKREVAGIAPERVTVRQTHAGTPTLVVGRHRRQTVKAGRRWLVLIDAVPIAVIAYEIVSHERRIPGRRWVESRWQAPAWFVMHDGRRGREHPTRLEAVEEVVQGFARADA